MYKVHFVGLVYFHLPTDVGKRALLPDGVKGDGNIPQHYCSLFVDAAQYHSDDWWPDERHPRTVHIKDAHGNPTEFTVYEFRIPSQAEIEFDLKDAKLHPGNLSRALPKPKETQADFELDLKNPDTIAEVPLRGGVLEAFNFGKVAVVQWSISDHGNPIVVTARTVRETRSIRIKVAEGEFGTEIVLGNSPDLLIEAAAGNAFHHGHEQATAPCERAANDDEEETNREKEAISDHNGRTSPSPPTDAHADHDHFKLYRKLSKSRKGDDLKAPADPPKLPLLRFGHRYLEHLAGRPQIPAPGCTPTCC